jgi:hypothetical protein
MADEEKVQYADYYQVTGGFTVGQTVAQDGEVLAGDVFGFTKDSPPIDEDEQKKRFGRVMYKEYTPDEEELAAIQSESAKVRSLAGMQSPDMPPVDVPAGGQSNLQMLSRFELRAMAKGVGLNFPEDTDRDQMIGAIQKKLKDAESAEAEDENDTVTKRRAHAREVIEKNNQTATGSSGEAPAQEEEEEEQPSA